MWLEPKNKRTKPTGQGKTTLYYLNTGSSVVFNTHTKRRKKENL
jgi:hypothetical protein